MATTQDIEALFKDKSVAVTGGGRGWTATLLDADGSIRARVKGTSKQGAIDALYDEVKVNRVKVEAALDVLGSLFGEFDVNEEDDDRTPGPVWKGATLVSIVPCVGECMGAQPESPCNCRCDGANHAIGGGTFAQMVNALIAANGSLTPATLKSVLVSTRPVMYRPKPCLCGCGESTLRRFVPGHDARYHAAIKAGFATVAEHKAAKALAANERATARAQREALWAQKRGAKAAAKAAAKASVAA